MSSAPLPLSRNLKIDAFRGWGCLLIVVLHSLAPWVGHRSLVFSDSDLTDFGTNLVSLFFCTSGFLVYQSLETLIHSRRDFQRAFYIRRFFRIVPLWWLLSLILYFSGFFSSKILWSQLFFYYGFFSYLPAYLPVIPAWSLFVEEIFYGVFPWVYNVVSSLKKAAICFGASVVVSWLWKNGAAGLGVPTDNFYISRHVFAKAPHFLSGIALFHLLRWPLFQQFIKTSASKGVLSGLGLVSLVMLFHHHFLQSFLWVPALCLVHLTSDHLFSWSEKISFLKFAGVRCYGIYILHSPLAELFASPFDQIRQTLMLESSSGLWAFLQATFTLITTVFVASIVYKYYEKPLLKKGYEL